MPLKTLSRRSFVAAAMLAMPSMATARSAGVEPYRNASLPIDVRVKDLLSRMTLEEKAAQLSCMWIRKRLILDQSGRFSAEKAAKVMPDGIGQIGRPGDTMGVAAPASGFRSIEETVDFVNSVQKYHVEHTRLGIPVLFHDETAHGLMARDATIFPIPTALGCTWDSELVEQAFAVAAREARLRGSTVALSPVLDIIRDPRFGRVEEFFGEDPYLVGKMGIAAVLGQQGKSRPLGPDKMFVTLKHFVHGVPQGGLNLAPSDVSERTMREVFIVPFEMVMRTSQPAIVMPSYNEVSGVPAHASLDLLQRTGRDRLGFKGAYFSDYSGIPNLVRQHHVAQNTESAAELAIHAGVDVDLPDGEAFRYLPKLVEAGTVDRGRLDEAVSRVLALKFEAGLFEHPYAAKSRAASGINTPAAIALARKVARKAIVLLANDGILPLDPRKKMKLAVIGPNAKEPLFGGYAAVNKRAIGILEGVTAAVGPGVAISYAEGVRLVQPDPSGEHAAGKPIPFVDSNENRERIAEAVAAASTADAIVLVLGDYPELTREAVTSNAPGDRSGLGLYGDQDALVEELTALEKPIIAVLINGRPLAVDRLAEKANALIEGWYLGQEGGNAVADVLFGKFNPGGKLSVSFPHAVGELPVFYNRHPSADINQYVEGPRKPLFPFGFGLSYTSFEISSPKLGRNQIGAAETTKVMVDVTNTGRVSGDEVVQLYIRDDVSSVPRPVIELRGFQRVTLSPGETKSIAFAIGYDELSFWNIDMRRVVEPGTFTVSIGPSSVKLKSVKLTVV